jgi:hypothetical protein
MQRSRSKSARCFPDREKCRPHVPPIIFGRKLQMATRPPNAHRANLGLLRSVCQYENPVWHPRRGKCFMMSPQNGMPWPRSRRCGARCCGIQYATAAKGTRRRRPWNSSPCREPQSARSANVPSARGMTTVAIGARWPSENPFPGDLRDGIRLGKSATAPPACPAGWRRPISSAVACLFNAHSLG